MILSAQSIAMRCSNPEHRMLEPFMPRTVANGMTFGLGPAGYDVRIAERVTIRHGFMCLVSTVERFRMPTDVLAKVADKSSWARKGLAVQNTIIEPGWHGFLTLELTFTSTVKRNRLTPEFEALDIEAGSPIAQIIFMQLDNHTVMPYNGKYQDQRAGAVPAIDER